MYTISKTSLHSAIDFAAEELKKYLRMMMPECGNIEIKYDTGATFGFRLGLMQDFGLDVSDADDVELDDILYIDTDNEGGIIAGDNPRSVLLAVYEYLRRNGCRWLFPGVDGEFIPMHSIVPVNYRHKPTSRYRGWCNEGSESQPTMIEAIDFMPKVGMNVFMIEFFIPTHYYSRYYQHTHNSENRPPEPVTNATILQWKRACESELSRRGLQLHDIGHGWGCESFGIDSLKQNSDSEISEEVRQFIAMVRGERRLPKSEAKNSQICMSNATARKKVVNYVADYAERATNVDYLHIWLGDGVNNHCECPECQKRTTSDWYVILLNEIDAELTRRKLNTRLVFIVYNDTIWAPVTEKIKNHKRFTLLLATINRYFTKPLERPESLVKVEPYKRNCIEIPKDYEKTYTHFMNWKSRAYKGTSVSYDYHFWRYQYLDVGGIELSKVINGDIKFYYENDINGAIEDGSQRSFFPTGLCFYTYARTLFDASLSQEEIAEDYFSHAFGKEWRAFYDYLAELGKAFNYSYMTGASELDSGRSQWYNPDHANSIRRAKTIIKDARPLVERNYNSEFRVQTVSVRLIEKHMKYAELLADAMVAKALGEDDEADGLYKKMCLECGKFEAEIERWYDHGLAFRSLNKIFESRTIDREPVIF